MYLGRDTHPISLSSRISSTFVVLALLFMVALVGWRTDLRFLLLLAALLGGLLLLVQPSWGPVFIVLAALVAPMDIPTGTQVHLNPVTLLVPGCVLAWLVNSLARGRISFVRTRADLPLMLFLLEGLFSLGIGNLLWDPAVPRPKRFILVQLAQWSIFAFSAGAYWLGANVIRDERWLKRLTWTFLLVGGGLAVLKVIPPTARLVAPLTTVAFVRAPFWALLAALSGGQLLFNRSLGGGRRLYLGIVLLAVFYYAFVLQREAVSNWVGVGAVLGVLFWLRWPRLRWPAVFLLVLLAAIGLLFPAVWGFAGGEREWLLSGGSRLTLIGRVVEVTLRNPLTGLGPAAYRHYAAMEPLVYRRAVWLTPQVNSHNNYVDIFSQTGVLGLAFFLWSLVELALAWSKAGIRPESGVHAAQRSAALAMLASAMVLMVVADWILPFVYNIGFPGFQASVLVWLFLGSFAMAQRGENPAA